MISYLVVFALLIDHAVHAYHLQQTQHPFLFDVDNEELRAYGEPFGHQQHKRTVALSPEEATGALRRIVYEVLHCMRPCLNNGITLLPRNTVDMCRCICPPVNYGLACEFEITEEEKRHRRLM